MHAEGSSGGSLVVVLTGKRESVGGRAPGGGLVPDLNDRLVWGCPLGVDGAMEALDSGRLLPDGCRLDVGRRAPHAQRRGGDDNGKSCCRE